MHTKLLGRDSHVVDAQVLKRAVDRLREVRVALPTFAQLANPALIPPGIREALSRVGPDDADPLNLFRVHWYNGASRTDVVDVPEHLVLPPRADGRRRHGSSWRSATGSR